MFDIQNRKSRKQENYEKNPNICKIRNSFGVSYLELQE